MGGVFVKYNVFHETLIGPIFGAQESHKAYTGARKITPEQQKVIALQLNGMKSNFKK